MHAVELWLRDYMQVAVLVAKLHAHYRCSAHLMHMTGTFGTSYDKSAMLYDGSGISGMLYAPCELRLGTLHTLSMHI